jgi:hypothetical protein
MIILALAVQLNAAPPSAPTPNFIRAPGAVQSIDYANMSIEDLAQIVMLETSKDARQDLRDEIEEMRKIASRRKAARELLGEMAEERRRLDDSVRRYFDEGAKTGRFTGYDDWLKSQSLTMPKVEVDETSGEAELPKPGKVSAEEAPPRETQSRTCVGRPDEDDCVIRAMQARLKWLRRRPGR